MATKRARSVAVDDDPTAQAIFKLHKGPARKDRKDFELWLLNIAYVLESAPELENLARALPAEHEEYVHKLSKPQNVAPHEIDEVRRVLDAALERLNAPYGRRWSDAQRATMNAAAERVVREAIASPGIQETVRAMLEDEVKVAVLQHKWIKVGVPTFIALALALLVGGTVIGGWQLAGVVKLASDSQTGIAKVASDSQTQIASASRESQAAIRTAGDDAVKRADTVLANKVKEQAAQIAADLKVEVASQAKTIKSAMTDGEKTLRRHRQLLDSLDGNLSSAQSRYAAVRPVATTVLAEIPKKIDTLSQRLADLRNMDSALDTALSQRRAYDHLVADLNSAAARGNIRLYAGRTAYASWECVALVDRCSLFVDLGTQGTGPGTRARVFR
jgi:O6-methylguanine-DNA--protein-cysteine methyltransferase